MKGLIKKYKTPPQRRRKKKDFEDEDDDEGDDNEKEDVESERVMLNVNHRYEPKESPLSYNQWTKVSFATNYIYSSM